MWSVGCDDDKKLKVDIKSVSCKVLGGLCVWSIYVQWTCVQCISRLLLGGLSLCGLCVVYICLVHVQCISDVLLGGLYSLSLCVVCVCLVHVQCISDDLLGGLYSVWSVSVCGL